MLQHTLLLHEYWESNSAVEVLGSSLGRSAWTVRKTSIFQRFATQQSFRAPDGVPSRLMTLREWESSLFYGKPLIIQAF